MFPVVLIIILHNNYLRQNILETFAVANGWQYMPKTYDFGSGTLFQHGHGKRGLKGIRGTLDGTPFSLFVYKYTVGSGKSQHTYDASVMRLTLPRVMPHMVIDSLIETGNGSWSTLPIYFDEAQRIELEGDSYKYFALYAPDKYGVTALTVIAPDVMEELLRQGMLCDIEIIDNKLYFYWPDLPSEQKDFELRFNTVLNIWKQLHTVLGKKDVFSTDVQAKIHSVASGRGVRLRTQKFSLPGTILIVAVIGLSTFMPYDKTGRAPLLMALLGGAGGVYAIISIVRKHNSRLRLRRELQERYQYGKT
jgi:hypothetical protein